MDDDYSYITQSVAKIQKEFQRQKEQEESEIQKEKEYVRSLLKVAHYYDHDSKLLKHEEEKNQHQNEIKKVREEISFIEKSYNEKQKKAFFIKDRGEKASNIDNLKKAKKNLLAPLQKRLSELLLIHEKAPEKNDVDVLATTNDTKMPNLKRIIDAIATLKKDKKRVDKEDRLAIDLEIGKLYVKILEVEKAIPYLEKACHIAEKNAMGGALKIANQRARESHGALYQIYLNKKMAKETAGHMKKWLLLSEPKDRLKALEALEKILSKVCYTIKDEDLQTTDEIMRARLLKGELGSLSDLRFHVLQELLVHSPDDTYLLEAIGEMQVKCYKFTDAQKTFEQSMRTQEMKSLSLWAEVAEYKHSFTEKYLLDDDDPNDDIKSNLESDNEKLD